MQVIIRYNPYYQNSFKQMIPLIGNWGIVRIDTNEIQELYDNPYLEYAALPDRINFQLEDAKAASCISNTPRNLDLSAPSRIFESAGMTNLSETTDLSGTPMSARTIITPETGNGILIAIIDSGIDVNHPDFLFPDGQTRILSLWDQTLPTNGSSGKYQQGQIFSQTEINESLSAEGSFKKSFDFSGHGTHIAGICAGNGAASNGQITGVAPEASLLIVKLYTLDQDNTSTTAYLMMAVDYCVNFALEKNLPLVINLSYGTNFGSHTGLEMVNNFLSQSCGIGKCCLCIGTGNEGVAGKHASVDVSSSKSNLVEFNISEYESQLTLSISKSFLAPINFTLIAPDGSRSQLITEIFGSNETTENNRTFRDAEISRNTEIFESNKTTENNRTFRDAETSRNTETFRTTQERELSVGTNKVLLSYHPPTPFTTETEIILDFLPDSTEYLMPGIWSILVEGNSSTTNKCELWLPSGNVNNTKTRFLRPDETMTLTVPGTTPLAISVGGYNSNLDSPASFSGRGYTNETATCMGFIKPDLCAPAVDILAAAPGGGYTMKTGTSMAVPFVSGSCARLMEWGIKKSHDPFLYGEKAKAYLIRGARKLPAFSSYPNPVLGHGCLCLNKSYPPFR